MPLRNNEVNELIKKLREKYKEYSKNYHQKWFDLDAFDERLSLAIKSMMDMEGFILAEISNFEKLKTQYENKKKSKENLFSKEVDKIIEENLSRIKKYPQILFHPKSGMEISYIYGALSFLLTYIFPITRIVITDVALRKKIDSLEDRLIFLADKRGDDIYSKRISDHILLLNRQGVRAIEIEKDSSDYLKESGFLLHDIIYFCDSIIDLKNDEWNYPITFQKLFIEEERKKTVIDLFKDLTGYGAILKIKEYSSGIIEDFRLKAFKQNV
ncbi:MAG: phage scaffolding protein [Spirochaetes bacterium]|nr:phage scaffolding protein [Spirochaetota bacterium]